MAGGTYRVYSPLITPQDDDDKTHIPVSAFPQVVFRPVHTLLGEHGELDGMSLEPLKGFHNAEVACLLWLVDPSPQLTVLWRHFSASMLMIRLTTAVSSAYLMIALELCLATQ